MLIGYVVLLWRELGPSCLAGFAAMLMLMCVQAYLGKRMGGCRREIAVAADVRIGAMSEVLNGVRVIKMYAWEKAFSKLVGELRRCVQARTHTHTLTLQEGATMCPPLFHVAVVSVRYLFSQWPLCRADRTGRLLARRQRAYGREGVRRRRLVQRLSFATHAFSAAWTAVFLRSKSGVQSHSGRMPSIPKGQHEFRNSSNWKSTKTVGQFQ
jgi:hypothetical protein